MTTGWHSTQSGRPDSARYFLDGTPLMIEVWPDSDGLSFPDGLSEDGLTGRRRR
jgi:hypothetical protein